MHGHNKYQEFSMVSNGISRQMIAFRYSNLLTMAIPVRAELTTG